MEIVILDDMVATFNTTWVRLANTAGHEAIRPGDEFQENGALEEFSVEATSFSPVPGASRIRLLRAHHSTKAEVHKAGAVLRQTNETWPGRNAFVPDHPMASALDLEAMHMTVTDPYPDIASDAQEEGPVKRGRGRPKGSPNKSKQPLVPVWPGVT